MRCTQWIFFVSWWQYKSTGCALAHFGIRKRNESLILILLTCHKTPSSHKIYFFNRCTGIRNPQSREHPAKLFVEILFFALHANWITPWNEIEVFSDELLLDYTELHSHRSLAFESSWARVNEKQSVLRRNFNPLLKNDIMEWME